MKTFKQLQLNLRHCLYSFLQSSSIGRLSIFQDPLDFSKVRRLHLEGNKAQNLLKKGAQYYFFEKKKSNFFEDKFSIIEAWESGGR